MRRTKPQAVECLYPGLALCFLAPPTADSSCVVYTASANACVAREERSIGETILFADVNPLLPCASHGVYTRNSSDSDTNSEEEDWKALEVEDRKRTAEQERKQAQVRKQLVYDEKREEFGGWTEHEQQSEQPSKKRVKHTTVKAKAKGVSDDEMTVAFQLDADGVILID